MIRTDAIELERVKALLANGPTTIKAIVTALAGEYDYTSEHSWSAEAYLEQLGCTPILDTPEKAAAQAMREKDGCLDDWPGGQELGYAVLDGILWKAPAGVENVVLFA